MDLGSYRFREEIVTFVIGRNGPLIERSLMLNDVARRAILHVGSGCLTWFSDAKILLLKTIAPGKVPPSTQRE
jgi:hypothetical protein